MIYLKKFENDNAYKAFRDNAGGGGTLSPMCPSAMTTTRCIIIILLGIPMISHL